VKSPEDQEISAASPLAHAYYTPPTFDDVMDPYTRATFAESGISGSSLFGIEATQ